MTKLCPRSLSCVWLFATPWTVALQAPLFMGFSRQEYWSRLPFPFPGDKTRKYIKFSLRGVDCTHVQPWSGTLRALSSLMSPFAMLVFNREALLPCKTGDVSPFPLHDCGSWLLPCSYDYSAHQLSGQINSLPQCRTGQPKARSFYLQNKLQYCLKLGREKKATPNKIVQYCGRWELVSLTLVFSETAIYPPKAEQIMVLHLIFCKARNCGVLIGSWPPVDPFTWERKQKALYSSWLWQ